MPHVYFEENELTHCPWCDRWMVRSIVDVLCVHCTMCFTERLHPRSIWTEPTLIAPFVRTCDKKDFGDSVYERSDICTSTRATDTREEHTVVADTGGSLSGLEMERQLTMYDKLADVMQNAQGPFLLEEDVWMELVRSDSLSNCWVAVSKGDGLVKLALPEFQCLSPYFTVEAPMGFLVIDCKKRICFHVCNLGNIEFCGLRSACHYLRSYPRQTLGFILTQVEEGHEEIAIAQCATSERSFLSNRRWFHTAQVLMDRMLKVIISRYEHVAFRRGQTK